MEDNIYKHLNVPNNKKVNSGILLSGFMLKNDTLANLIFTVKKSGYFRLFVMFAEQGVLLPA